MKKRFLGVLLTLCMLMSMLSGMLFSASAATDLNDIVVDSSIGSDSRAVITATETTTGEYYAILGKNGVITNAAVSGGTKGSNGWYKADGTGGIEFSGIDPAQMPFQIVSKSEDTQAPGTTATNLTNGSAVGNCIYYYYVANTNTAEEYAIAGADTNAGTKEAPFSTIQKAIDSVQTNQCKQQGVVVLLDDSTITSIIWVPRDTKTTNVSEGKNITITSDVEQHKIIRNFRGETTTIQTFIGSKLVLDNVTVDDNKQYNPFSTVFVDPYSTMILRGNSKLINGANRAVNVRANATFIMESGEISGNTAAENTYYRDQYTGLANAGGGVYICPAYTNSMEGGTFIMTGGKITGNTASAGAAGIFGEAGTTIKISGDAQVYGNVDTNNNPSNIYLKDGQTITLTGSLSDTANLGVYVTDTPAAGEDDVPIAVSDGTYTVLASDARSFTSDKATTAGIKLSEGQIVMSAAAKATALTVSGSVSDYTGGKNNLTGITVSLYDAEDTTYARPLYSALTDASGNYSIQATVKPGNYVVYISEKANCFSSVVSSPIPISGFGISGVNLTLSKYTKSVVVLNTPVFNNDKSGYSFKSAVINNFAAVTAITLSATKGTTVQFVPTFLTPTSTLESINGETRTFAYVFEKGITVSQAEEFLRGIVFNYEAGAEISVTVDNNPTKLPDGAKITEYNQHYYMFVPFINDEANISADEILTWNQSYELAKGYRYMGMIGYLATITSEKEDEVLNNVSMSGGWSGGSRYTKSDDSATAPATDSDKDNYFKWTCGPEHGQKYYYYESNSNKYPVDNSYSGFKDTGEPNNFTSTSQSVSSGNYEYCMQIHHLSGTIYTWNDLAYNAKLSATYGTPYVTGYFVEFSNYEGGLDSQYSGDKTAISAYSLTEDGGVQEVATVTLNEHTYGSDNAIFSFKSAEIANCATVYSLTIKLDNYTNVLSYPSSSAATNVLSNIAGDTNTIIYEFRDGITQAQAQEFLRGIVFRYGGLAEKSTTTNVSVTVDGNATNLPDGASITEYNGHYYMYVAAKIPWNEAYNKAKSYSYTGLRGYLATITSAEEDSVLTQISDKGAWSGGSRMLKSDGSMILDDSSYTLYTGAYYNQFYWTCGPEAGLVYFTGKTADTGSTPTGIYNNWKRDANGKEPNNYYTTVNESCMQVNFSGSSGATVKKWNDLRYDPLSETIGYEVTGYFVEFSDYTGGLTDDYVANATGKCSVPIFVSKGEVFNTVEDGGTYYVDMPLKVFDRNISGIKVNGSPVQNGAVLSGDEEKTYSIVAEDLSGKTATTVVYMKKIDSISEGIKDLTVDTVQMSDRDAILEAERILKSIDQTTATQDQKNKIAAAIQNCKNLYFALYDAEATAPNGLDGWYKAGIAEITLRAPQGFFISTSATGPWTQYLVLDQNDGANKAVTYYLQDGTTEDVSPEKSFSYRVDTTPPENLDIQYHSDSVLSSISPITFGTFFKEPVVVSVEASDTVSLIGSIEYYKSDAELTQDALKSVEWTEYNDVVTGTAEDGERFIYYARITDRAGNAVIISSKGAVYDLTPPVISGVSGDVTYYTSQILSARDENTVTITVNGEPFTSGDKLSGDLDTVYEIRATDEAGNETVLTVTMKPISILSDGLEDILGKVKPTDKEKIELIKKNAEAVDTEAATDAEKQALQDLIDQCDGLLKEIETQENTPKTGSSSNWYLWMILLLGSAAALTLIGTRKKHRTATGK